MITPERLDELFRYGGVQHFARKPCVVNALELRDLIRDARLKAVYKAECEAYRAKQLARRRESGDQYQRAVQTHKDAMNATDRAERSGS